MNQGIDPALLETLSHDDIMAELQTRSMHEFIKGAWDQIEPGRQFHDNWHIEAICEHLEAVARGQLNRLIINIPPRHMKSLTCGVAFPCWTWIHAPHKQFLFASYSKALSTRDNVKCRRLLTSPWYQNNWGDKFKLTTDQNQKARFENNATGYRIATSVGGSLTGKGGDRIVVDDPHNVREAQSDDQRNQVIEWWDQTMSTRRNDPKRDSRVVIMQRLHEEDLAGHCIEKGYEHVCLPLQYEAEHPHKSRTSLYLVDPRTTEGEMLMPARAGVAEAAQAVIDLGTYGYVGQMQQRPSPGEGGILKKSWFQRFDAEPATDSFDRIITTWDLTFKGKDKSKRSELEAVKKRSWVVGLVLGSIGANTWMLDLVRGQWNIKEAMEEMLLLHSKWPKATGHIVEDKANGPAVETMLKDTIPGIVLVNPRGSKIQRAYAVAPIIEAGNVYVGTVRHSPWVGDFFREITTFPFGKTDDQVDALTQGLIHEQVDETMASLRALEKMVG